MTTEQRIAALLLAPPETLARIDTELSGRAAPSYDPTRLLTHAEAARRISASRTTIWRMQKDGFLQVVEIRPGVFRVAETTLAALVASARPRPSFGETRRSDKAKPLQSDARVLGMMRGRRCANRNQSL